MTDPDAPPDPQALKAASDAGDAQAAHLLAVLAGVGFRMAQDWGAALGQLARAADLGLVSAREQLALLTGDDEARVAIRAGEGDAFVRAARAVDVNAWLRPPPPRVISTGPHVLAVPGFLSVEICDWLAARAEPDMEAAEVYDPVTGQGRIESARTNSARAFQLTELDLVMVLVRERVARMTGLPVHGLEPLQVLRYEPGQKFDWHVDYLTPDRPGLARDLAEKGQRIATALVYLNDDFEGGETAFETLNLKHRGAKGDALVWANTLPDGRVDTRTRHAGLPPTVGVKRVLSQWCRGGAPRR